MGFNTDTIYEAATNLEQITGAPVAVESQRANCEVIMTIKGIQFVVELKSSVRKENTNISIMRLLELQSAKKPVILVADYIAKESAKELKAQKINYIDRAGNCFISNKDLFLLIEGQKRVQPGKTNQTRAFQEAGIKVIFHLLNRTENLQDSYRKIAKAVDVSLGSVTNVMAELEELNYLFKTKNKRVLKNKEELLERWVVEYNAVLRPRLLRRKMRFNIKDPYGNWQDLPLKKYQNEILWGGEPAAARITNHLSPEQFILFTNLEMPTLVKEFSLLPDEQGEVEVFQKFWHSNASKAGVAPALLVYADLINSGFGRNLEIAKMIKENELQHIQ